MKKTIKITMLLFCLQLFYNCNDKDAELCVEPPCGTIATGTTNLTILNKGQNIDVVGISIGDESKEIDVDGWDFAAKKYYTCWTEIPAIDINKEFVLIYNLNGETIVGVLNTTNATSSKLVIEINGDNAELKNYTECMDF